MMKNEGQGVGINEKWRFINDGWHSGCSNMARDEALAVSVGKGSTPALRVYRFCPTTISIGRFQKFGMGLDIEACHEEGLDVVRRPTGGLAILHAYDFTYSVALASKENGAVSRERWFTAIATGIIKSLEVLGVSALLSRHHDGRNVSSAWCLESVSGIDLETGGRKLCGSAQRVFPGAVLQHGTIFLRDNVEMVGRITTGASNGIPYGRSFITLSEACGREITWDTVRSAFETRFAPALEVEMEPSALSEKEESLARRLTEEKYSSEEWNVRGEVSRLSLCDII